MEFSVLLIRQYSKHPAWTVPCLQITGGCLVASLCVLIISLASTKKVSRLHPCQTSVSHKPSHCNLVVKLIWGGGPWFILQVVHSRFLLTFSLSYDHACCLRTVQKMLLRWVFHRRLHLSTNGIQNFCVLSVQPELVLVLIVKYFTFPAGSFFSSDVWSNLESSLVNSLLKS